MHICPLGTSLVAVEVRKGHQTFWNWSYGWFWATMWVLRTEPRSSTKHLLLLSAELSLQCYLLCSLNILLIHSIYLCRWIYVWVVVRKQLVGVSFLPSLFRSRGSNFISQAWWQGLPNAEPFHHWRELFVFIIETVKLFLTHFLLIDF